jgi:hypothetical protein
MHLGSSLTFVLREGEDEQQSHEQLKGQTTSVETALLIHQVKEPRGNSSTAKEGKQKKQRHARRMGMHNTTQLGTQMLAQLCTNSITGEHARELLNSLSQPVTQTSSQNRHHKLCFSGLVALSDRTVLRCHDLIRFSIRCADATTSQSERARYIDDPNTITALWLEPNSCFARHTDPCNQT